MDQVSSLPGFAEATPDVVVAILEEAAKFAGGWQMGCAAAIARRYVAAGDRAPFWPAKLATARFYADHFLTQAPGLAEAVIAGASGILEMAADSSKLVNPVLTAAGDFC